MIAFLRTVLIVAGLAVLLRACTLMGHSPVAAETAFALALFAWVAIRARNLPSGAPTAIGDTRIVLVVILILTAVCFAPGLPLYFLSDDFLMLDFCKRWAPVLPLHSILAGSTSGGAFFRPVEALTGIFECGWAGTQPLIWHAVELALHLVNCVLAYFVARALFSSASKGIWTAVLFGLHPGSTEAVSWVAGQNTVIATTFVLATVALYLAWLRGGRILILLASLLACILALGTKEVAFVLPILLTAIAFHQRARLRGVYPYYLLTAGMFIYRWRVLGGMGGYTSVHVSTFGASKALLLRIWAVLLFPLNWSVAPEIYLVIGIAAGVTAYIGLTLARPSRRDIALAMIWMFLCAAPGVQTLLIGPDLLNSHLIYLSAAGLAMFLACCIEALPKLRQVIGGALLLFFIAAVEHNLAIRARVAEVAQRQCMAAARGEKIGTPPKILDGIWLFSNGFDECVAMQKLP